MGKGTRIRIWDKWHGEHWARGKGNGQRYRGKGTEARVRRKRTHEQGHRDKGSEARAYEQGIAEPRENDVEKGNRGKSIVAIVAKAEV